MLSRFVVQFAGVTVTTAKLYLLASMFCFSWIGSVGLQLPGPKHSDLEILRLPSIRPMTNNLEAENAEFAAKKWVWMADPTDGFIKGFVVSEDADKYTVNCGDEVSMRMVMWKDYSLDFLCLPLEPANTEPSSQDQRHRQGEPAEIQHGQRYGRADVSQ